MKRAILLTFGWLASAMGLYVILVILELYWNLYDWQPRWDARASALLIGMVVVLAAMRWLARATRDRASQAVSLVLCLAMLGLGFYVLWPEPTSHGIFARERTSPFWYRAGRFVGLALPSLFWGLGLINRRTRGQNRFTRRAVVQPLDNKRSL